MARCCARRKRWSALWTIFEFSEYLTDILVRHPAEVTLLEQIAERPGPEAQSCLPGPTRAEDDVPDPGVRVSRDRRRWIRSEAMSILRQHYRRRVFLSGALDLFHLREVFDSLKRQHCRRRCCHPGGAGHRRCSRGFAVMGLGRLGAHEFDLLSDADVLFVCGDSVATTRRCVGSPSA